MEDVWQKETSVFGQNMSLAEAAVRVRTACLVVMILMLIVNTVRLVRSFKQ